MGQRLQLVLYGTNATLLEQLKRCSSELPYLAYQPGDGPHAVITANLDALWVTLSIGMELFDAAPPFPLHEARVLRTPPAQLQRGMPRYGAIGVATTSDDPRSPEFNLRLVLSALLKAVNSFNASETDQIRRIGILPEDLDLQRLECSEAVEIIREIYETS